MAANPLTEQIMEAAIEEHRELGPALLESACQRALAHEFERRGNTFEQESPCWVDAKDLLDEAAYRPDFLVEGLVVLALKAVEVLTGAPSARVLTYLKFSQCRPGAFDEFFPQCDQRAV